MILECDIGNTRCKWRVVDEQGAIVDRGSFVHAEGFAGLPATVALQRIRVACVAAAEVKALFIDWVRGCCDIQPEFAFSSAFAVNVSSAYGTNASCLGVDRWLAVVAAYNRKQTAVLVIDAGSALTVDLVAVGGEHLGGYIVPGVEAMKRSLLRDTGGVRFDMRQGEADLGFGCNTLDGVHAGVLASQVGVISIAIREAKRRISTDLAILLTGGGAASMAQYVESEIVELKGFAINRSGLSIVEAPDLVLDGLRLLLP